MASAALVGLLAGVAEVNALQRANPTPQQGGGFTRPEVVRAIGRAEVVLLSSHFERFMYALNEEAVGQLVANQVPVERVPDTIRLRHSRLPIDELALTEWTNRAHQLREFSSVEAKLWTDGSPLGELEPMRLLEWMKAPKCQDVVRFFRLWGVEDIFVAVTRTDVSKARLRLRIDELVRKRNDIAHGDLTVEAQYLDVEQYKGAVRKFCTSADKVMSRRVARIAQTARPW